MEEYKFKSFDSFHIGDKATIKKTFSEEEVRLFSELTGDLNPIHLDEEYAAKSYFGTRLVQGAFVDSVIGALLAPFCGIASINMGQTWKCPAPTRIGDTVTYLIEVIELVKDKHDVIVKMTGLRQDGAEVFSGTNRIRIMDKK